MSADETKNPKGLRVIKTARDEKSINEAARAGFWPVVKKVDPSPEINCKFAVYQNEKTGEIEVVGDYRSSPGRNQTEVIGWTRYYPNPSPSPFAAYLIPKDIKPSEMVFLEDLIEDFIGGNWNQGDAYRLESCEAYWNGKDLVVQYVPEVHRRVFVG